MRPWVPFAFAVASLAATPFGCAFDLAGTGELLSSGLDGSVEGLAPGAPRFVVEPAQVSIDEATLSTATFTVKLAQAPTADVSVPISIAPSNRVKASTNSLVFTPDNFGTAQTVSLTTTLNSEIDPPEFTAILGVATSKDPVFDGADPPDVKVTFFDANEAVIVSPRVTPPAFVSEEKTTTKFYVQLGAQPTDAVTVKMHVTTPTEIQIGASDSTTDAGVAYSDTVTLIFPARWETGKSKEVTVIGVDDDVKDGDQTVQILFDPVTTTDVRFAGKQPSPLAIINKDNDTPNVIVSKSTVATREGPPGQSDTFAVHLTTKPSGPVGTTVTFGVSSDNTAEAVVAPANLVFTQANWQTDQVVTVTGVADSTVDGNQSFSIPLAAAVSADPDYAGKFATVISGVNTDIDVPTIVADVASVATTESGSPKQIKVKLGRKPAGNVTVGVASNNTAIATVDSATLTFTPANFATTQTITVTGVDDNPPAVNAAKAYTVTLSSQTAGYAATNVVVNGSNGDNDVAQVNSSSLATIAEGSSGSFNVSLQTQPTNTVVVNVAAPSTNGKPAVTVNSGATTALTFTPGNWNVAQSVTVAIGEDCYAGGQPNLTILVTMDTVNTLDNVYDTALTPDVTLQWTNNEPTTSITVTPTAPPGPPADPLQTKIAPSTTDSFTIALNTRPLADLTMTVAESQTGSPTRATVAPTSVTFTTGATTCPLAQTVTVSPGTGTGKYTITVGNPTGSATDYGAGKTPTPSTLAGTNSP